MDMFKIIDAHVHAFPSKLFNAIWAYFERHYWHVQYKLDADAIIAFLKARGILHVVILNYAHEPGMSRALNDWTKEFSRRHECVHPLGTIHPRDPWLEDELDRVLGTGDGCLDLGGLKIQLLVTDFDPGIRRMDAVYEALLEHEKIIVMHAGTGPIANEHVGIGKVRAVLDRYPRLRLQVPHLGCFEYNEFLDLVEDFSNVYLDTAMVLVDHGLFDGKVKEEALFDRLVELQDRLLFGSDFPNIPYDYHLSIESIKGLPVEESMKRKIFSENATNFYRLP
ncbi:amidohydrolase family protein [Candidatus Bathyarchaeota archaeon]|nr:amidohydrolase family protein [Candidatus Bathyarchaeota archaeon]